MVRTSYMKGTCCVFYVHSFIALYIYNAWTYNFYLANKETKAQSCFVANSKSHK